MRKYYVNRTLCDVLEELRTCTKTLNFSGMLGLIEEAQSMANRMEAGLGENRDLEELHQEWDRMRKKVKKARKK